MLLNMFSVFHTMNVFLALYQGTWPGDRHHEFHLEQLIWTKSFSATFSDTLMGAFVILSYLCRSLFGTHVILTPGGASKKSSQAVATDT